MLFWGWTGVQAAAWEVSSPRSGRGRAEQGGRSRSCWTDGHEGRSCSWCKSCSPLPCPLRLSALSPVALFVPASPCCPLPPARPQVPEGLCASSPTLTSPIEYQSPANSLHTPPLNRHNVFKRHSMRVREGFPHPMASRGHPGPGWPHPRHARDHAGGKGSVGGMLAVPRSALCCCLRCFELSVRPNLSPHGCCLWAGGIEIVKGFGVSPAPRHAHLHAQPSEGMLVDEHLARCPQKRAGDGWLPLLGALGQVFMLGIVT